MTEEQRQFAADRHNLIYAFLHEKGWAPGEYYDIAAFGFLRAVMRYEDAEDPLKEISLFLQWLQRIGIGEQYGRAAFTIRENACEAMFSSLYTKYLLAAKRLMSITQEQFIREHEKLENALIDLKLVVADPFGYWVALDQEEPVPFAWFLRKAEVGVPYYIGTVLCSYA